MLPLLIGLTATACARPESTVAFRLVEKGHYQALYGSDGRLTRVLADQNADGVADAVVLCGPDGRPRAGELDTDLDGRVDRWEVFGPDGRLERVGTSSGKTGRPDRWEAAGSQSGSGTHD